MADLVLFDPAVVSDRSTFQEPATLAVGIKKVFVSGTLVWDEGCAHHRAARSVPPVTLDRARRLF